MYLLQLEGAKKVINARGYHGKMPLHPAIDSYGRDGSDKRRVMTEALLQHGAIATRS